MCELVKEIDAQWVISDELWAFIESLLPKHKKKTKVGRPREDDRKMMNTIFYLLRTGCQWKALPRSLGASSTVHDRFQEWVKAGVFEHMWHEGLQEYDPMKGIDWKWQAMDGAMTKAPLGGEKNGAQSNRPRKIRNQEKPFD